jgi:hypothetical protein
VKGEDGILSRIPAKKWLNVVKRDLAVFAFFVFLSFALWYINFLGKELETEVSYPAMYVNIPKDRDISEDMPLKLNFVLKGPGFSILKFKMSDDKFPVKIDLSQVSYKRVPDSKPPSYFILTSVIQKNLSQQLRSGCEIITVKPDTLFFSLNRKASNPGTGR